MGNGTLVLIYVSYCSQYGFMEELLDSGGEPWFSSVIQLSLLLNKGINAKKLPKASTWIFHRVLLFYKAGFWILLRCIYLFLSILLAVNIIPVCVTHTVTPYLCGLEHATGPYFWTALLELCNRAKYMWYLLRWLDGS